MPMPSLLRYFVVVGSALLGLLFLVNHLFAPPPEPAMAAVAPKVVVRHDPRASLIERWRNEQAARKAAERGEPAPQVAAAPEPQVAAALEPATPVSDPSPTRPEPPQIVAPVSLTTASVAAATPAAPAEPDPEARKAEQLKAAQARNARIARERARKRQEQQQQETASRQQDQFYYGASRRAEAPAFGPFGGWGRTW